MGTRKRTKRFVFGVGLALLLTVGLLLTVCMQIDFARADEAEVYHGPFVGYSGGLSEKELYDATNTYNFIDYQDADVYLNDYRKTESGVKIFKDWYDLSMANGKTVSTDAPSITVFTHGLGANAKHWSNDGAGHFAYDEQSAVEQLNGLVKHRTGQEADKYLVKFLDDEPQNFYLASLNGTNVKEDNTYIVFDKKKPEKPETKQKLEDSPNHKILIFESANPSNSNNYIYKQFNYALSKIIYDVAYFSGGVLPRVNLVGHSRGGLTNLQYALDHPDLVDSLFSFDTPYLGSHSAKTDIAAMFMDGEGLKSINDADVYYRYNSRWNDHYDTLYKDIAVHAMGGYSDTDFLLDSMMQDDSMAEWKTAFEVAKRYLNYGATVYGSAVAIYNLIALSIDQTTTGWGEFGILLVGVLACGINPYALTSVPEVYLSAAGVVKEVVEQLAGKVVLPVDFMIYTDVLKDMKYESFWKILFGGAPIFYNDVCVDLDSQIGKDENRTYTGFQPRVKKFNAQNTTRLYKDGPIRQGVNDQPPVVHNMSLYDGELIKHMLSRIEVGGTPQAYLSCDVKNGREITMYTGNIQGGALEIPGTLDGKPVVSIGMQAFSHNFYDKAYSEVVVPDSVERIGAYAFGDCSELTSITFGPNSALRWIEDGAFSGCTKLESITLPAQVEYIGLEAFQDCPALTSITIAQENTKYASQDGVLFNQDYTQLIQYPIAKPNASYTLPDVTEYVYSKAFADNTHLQSVDLNNVQVLAEHAFFNCNNLAAVKGGNRIEVMQMGVFGNTAWYDSLTDEYEYLGSVLMKYNGTAEELDLSDAPQPFKIIASGAFYENENLKKVMLPDGVDSVSTTAFYGCDNLQEVYLLPFNSVVDIGYMAFGCQEGLKIYVSKQVDGLYKNNLVLQMYGYTDILTLVPVRVNFDAAGGEACESIDLDYGGLITTLPEHIKKEFHLFDGWYFDDQKYQNGVLWDRLEETTLTAHWIAKNYSIEYVNNAVGSENPACNPLYFNIHDDFELRSPTAIANYDFIGWYDNAEFAGDAITNVNQLTGHTVLYARFDPHRVTVHFDLNYDTNDTVADTTVAYGSIDYSFAIPTRTGYDFIEWYYLQDGVKQPVWNAKTGPYSSWYLTEDVTLYAEWLLESYWLEFKSNGEYLLDAAGNRVNSKRVSYGETISKTEIMETLNAGANGAYRCTDITIEFVGFAWDSIPDLGDNNCIVTANVFVDYETFTLVFLSADGNVYAEKEYRMKDSITPLPNFDFVPAGQYIDGWIVSGRDGENINHPLFDLGDKLYFEQTVGGTMLLVMPDLTAGYFGNASIVLSPDMKYFEYTIYIHDDSDSIVDAFSGIQYGNAYSLPIPTKTGHDFVEYYYESNGQELHFPISGNYDLTDNVHVRMRFAPKVFTITYETAYDEEVIAGTVRETYAYGESFLLPTFDKVGYLFDGLYIKNTLVRKSQILSTDCQNFVLVPRFIGAEYTLSATTGSELRVTAEYSIVKSFSSSSNRIRCKITVAPTVTVFTIRSNYNSYQNTSIFVAARNTPILIILDNYLTYGYDNSPGIYYKDIPDMTIRVNGDSFIAGANSTDEDNPIGNYGIYKSGGTLTIEPYRQFASAVHKLTVMGGSGYSFLNKVRSSPKQGGAGGVAIMTPILRVNYIQLKVSGGAGACGSDGDTGLPGTASNVNGGAGVDGGAGGVGGNALYLDTLVCTASIVRVSGGDGGSGGIGGKGGNGYTQTGVGGGSYQPDGLRGGDGGTGGRGGRGGDGGYGFYGVRKLETNADSILEIYGGDGGYGMSGGSGGNGGDGGDGGKGEWNKRGGNGGDGGNGGNGGRSGDGGNGQKAASLSFVLNDACTWKDGSGKDSVGSNPGGAGGIGGAGGAKGGWFNSAGSKGADGSRGSYGASGTDGTP